MTQALDFDAMYRDYSARLTAFCRLITRDAADFEDVAQVAWIETWRNLDAVDPARVWPWLKMQAKRAWFRMVNVKRGANGDRWEPAEVALPIEEAGEVGEEPVEQERAAQAVMLRRAIDRMGHWAGSGNNRHWRKAHAATVEIAYAVACNDVKADVAKARGTSEQTIRATMAKAIAMLRQQWGLT